MEQKFRKAHQQFCQAMAQWHVSKGEAWVEQQREQAAKAQGVDPQEFKEWQQK